TKTRGWLDNLHFLEKLRRRALSSLYLETEDAAVELGAEQLPRCLVVRAVLQSGIVDAFDLRMLVQELRNGHRALALRLEPDLQGAHAPQREEGFEGAHDRTESPPELPEVHKVHRIVQGEGPSH